MQGELAGDRRLALAGGLHARALESRLRELPDIEEVGAFQMLVALGVVRVDARRIDLDLDLRSGRVLFVVGEGAAELIEAAGEPAEAQMADAEVDRGMVALRVDLEVFGRRRLKQRQRAGNESKRGEDKLHEFCSICVSN